MGIEQYLLTGDKSQTFTLFFVSEFGIIIVKNTSRTCFNTFLPPLL